MTAQDRKPLSQYAKQQLDRAIAWAANFVASPFWVMKVMLVCVAFTVLCSGGFDLKGVRAGYPPSYYQKVEHPLLDMTRFYPFGSHDEKLNYRLTVPVLLHPLGLPSDWVLHVTLPALTIIGICCVIFLSCLVAFQITGDRVVGFFIALNVCATYVGSFGCIGYYDAIAMVQVLLAMMPGINPVGLGVLVFTAAFTDERAFVACGLLLVRELCVPVDSPNPRSRFLSTRFLAAMVGMVSYWFVRLLLTYRFGLTSTRTGVGPGTFVDHVKDWHPGAWFALKGGWLLVLLATLAMWQHRQRLRAWLFLLGTMAVLTFGFTVGDLLRSTSYVYPVVFIALAIICQNETSEMTRLYCLFAFLISAVAGNYNVFLGQVTWFLPLPVVVANEVAHVLYEIFRLVVFHGMP